MAALASLLASVRTRLPFAAAGLTVRRVQLNKTTTRVFRELFQKINRALTSWISSCLLPPRVLLHLSCASWSGPTRG